MLFLTATYLDLMPWLVFWLIIPGLICLARPAPDATRPEWDT